MQEKYLAATCPEQFFSSWVFVREIRHIVTLQQVRQTDKLN